jgi:hypothetical protein
VIGAEGTVSPEETVTRFLTHQSSFNPRTRKIRYAVFDPPSSLALSVYRVAGMDDVTIWSTGDGFVAPYRGTVLARADLPVAQCHVHGLSVAADPQPHPAHANIVGWPGERSKQIALAKELAIAATLIVRS